MTKKKKLTESELLYAAKQVYSAKPFVTKIWFKMNGWDADFIDKYWEKIIASKN